MITDERIESFINSMSMDEEGVIGEIEKEAVAGEVPIIRKVTREWMKTMLLIHQPMRVLEVGTAVGFSAIYMSRYLPPSGHITTIENWAPRIEQAKENFKRAGVTDRVTLMEGDAADILRDLKGPYDFIFMDAAKGQYIYYLPDVVRLLTEGGVLISDNVLQDGEVLDSKYVVERRKRTIHMRMREYLYVLKHHELLETAILPLGDGVALSVKKVNDVYE
ncbi:MAG: O-methyltransferase [Lachnospiraceae bacterium]|nr:O-methyltransferase [Lachnospiraceae bacterium]MDE6626590.1 O-methyltransferase [Lachnospiraceae bacterium]